MNKKNVQRFIDEWNDTLQIVYTLTEEIKKANQVVNIEIGRLKNKNENEFLREMQPWFRIVIRSTIATIEAICYKFKQVTILTCDHRKIPLTPTEREKLTEKKQDEDGKLRNYYLETKENIKFALKKIYDAVDLHFEIEDHEGWKKLLDTIDIRHKLTHPKKKVNLDISPQQWNDASTGFCWFSKKIEELNKSPLFRFEPSRSQKS